MIRKRSDRSLGEAFRRFCVEGRRMTSTAEDRRPLPTDAETILNALPNPVLLVGPDGRSPTPIWRRNRFSIFRRRSCAGIR